MFERLMNLDVELKCLGTKMFVAKEQFVNDVFYSRPRKGTAVSENEEEMGETVVTKEDVSELLDKIKELKSEGEDVSEKEIQLKNMVDRFLNVSEEKKVLEKPVETKEQSAPVERTVRSGKRRVR